MYLVGLLHRANEWSESMIIDIILLLLGLERCIGYGTCVSCAVTIQFPIKHVLY